MKYVALLFTLLPTLSWLSGLPWLGVLVAFGIFPLLEWLVGRADGPWSLAHRSALSGVNWGDTMPRVIAIALLCQSLFFVVVVLPQASWAQALWLSGALGVVAGAIGITYAHELGHRRSELDRMLSLAMLTHVAYGHYQIEHNRGHHRMAASWEDPASARQSENLWTFMRRYFPGVWHSGVALSASANYPAWKRPAGLLAIYGAWVVLAFVAFGAKSGVAVLIQAAVGLYLVVAVDYVEHWGLVRERVDGRLERMGPQHIWDCNNWVSDLILINLPRHAHHHLSPSDGADQLRRTSASPQMPTGYSGMVILAAISPLFRRLMAPRLPAERTDAASTVTA